MKKIATALASAALLATLAAPAGAAVVPGSSNVFRHPTQRHQCYTGRPGERRGNCFDEHKPQHDGGGILF
jgi:uncharacterized low-complexity protein